jgi:uridine phosphorylase
VRADYPILEFDPSKHAVIEPHMVRERLDVSIAAVPCFFLDVIQRVCVDTGAKLLTHLQSAHGAHPVYEIDWEGQPLAVYHPGVGAPLAAMFLEEIIETGCRVFVAVGGAGGLVPALTVGHVVVPTSATRDEGTSYHYLPAGREIEPSPRASARSRRFSKDTGSRSSPARCGRPMRRTGRPGARLSVVSMKGASPLRWRQRLHSPSRHSEAWSSGISSLQLTTCRRSSETTGVFIPDTSVRERLFWLAVEAAASLAPM